MTADLDAQLLQGHWTHSYEESEDDRIVFRSSDYDFPPSRGRSSIVLGPDGVILTEYPGPTDRVTRATGDWSLEGNLLTLNGPEWSGTFEVEAVDEHMLIISKHEIGG